jgi:hypothetical protein
MNTNEYKGSHRCNVYCGGNLPYFGAVDHLCHVTIYHFFCHTDPHCIFYVTVFINKSKDWHQAFFVIR